VTAVVLDLAHRGEDELVSITDQARSVGGCESPVRMRGTRHVLNAATGEMAEAFSSRHLPDGVVHLRCKNRRASRCEPCSRLYQGDAYQLIVAGLVGGKGVPESVSTHPAVFVTLTAPSFGVVHVRRTNDRGEVLPCRARRDEAGQTCAHGRPITCSARHGEHDEALGQPLCVDCFDYGGAVVWNANAGELWCRTRIRLYRELAAAVGLSERALRKQVSVQYTKVAEYQRRGLVHFHLVVRLDGVDASDPEAIIAPPERFSAELLEAVIRAAVAHTEALYELPDTAELAKRMEAIRHRHVPEPNLVPWVASVRWGAQVDIAPIVADDDNPAVVQGKAFSRSQVAGYLAKYATKHTECVGGGLDRRLRHEDLATLVASDHVHRLVIAAWVLSKADASGNLGRWAHQLGFGGHFLTKSRRYSTTFGILRAARAAWQQQKNDHKTEPASTTDTDAQVILGHWSFVGVGWTRPLDAAFAKAVRSEAEVARQEARTTTREQTEILALAG
jgi:hypothetical protein